ncbi:HAL/PAL/TAL family ammonia-lyase [Hyphococcus luteus]|uniref:Histidine ammonia-lyase n=1 Tax=Hyphococcus luteus TaxID=2058213 RepID=A0A2S7K5A2_9PROT|nr:aromatic amino acid ammonia-lyase [Marinicaulis flavus]PQA87672.1 histidine ammonia-lyase [Marinicaulis flavus]
MIKISGDGLSLEQISKVVQGERVELADDPAVTARIEASCLRLEEAIKAGEPIYGVSTLYGGMADQSVPPERMSELQHIALWHHKTATGPRLAREDVRAAMLLRANTLAKGYSAVRRELIERYLTFLNNNVSPHTFKRGSIGASGDLVPLSYIGASVVGLGPAFMVDFDGEDIDCISALERLGMKPLKLLPKEGLALNNGTTASTGVAANNLDRACNVTALAFGVQALLFQALLATDHSFHPTIHHVKPHPGQVFVAAEFRTLLKDSKLIRGEAVGNRGHRKGKLIQDRYSMRCLPQYTGPIIDGLANAAKQITTEANTANDNPLIDPDTGEIYHTGNFLAQYTAVAMDDLRLHLAMLIKHLDVQIAMLVTPEFNQGLAASLVGNQEHGLNIGLKSLQVQCNSIAPLVQFNARSMADLYPTHAEQFNQNINSQAMNASNLARDSIELCEHFLACALVFAVQAVELRSKAAGSTYDATGVLSTATQPLYVAARTIAQGPPDHEECLVWDDMDSPIEDRVARLLKDIANSGDLVSAVRETRDRIASRMV